MKFLLAVVVIFFCPLAAYAEEVWLVVGASDLSPAGIAAKGKRLGIGSGIVINNRDCGENKDVFAWVLRVESSAGAAKESLNAAKTYISDAYIKKCQVKPGSLAGDEPLHRVVVYSMKGTKIAEVTQCRNPKLTTKRTAICDKESVGPDCHLELRKVEEPLSAMEE